MITPTPGGWLVHLGDFDDLVGAGNSDSGDQRLRTAVVTDPALAPTTLPDAVRSGIRARVARKTAALQSRGYAASRYARISPPSRSRQQTRSSRAERRCAAAMEALNAMNPGEGTRTSVEFYEVPVHTLG